MFRPMSFGEIIDGIFRSLRKTFWPLWWFHFLFNVPIELFSIYWESIESSKSEWIPFILFIGIYLFFLFPIFQNACTNVVIQQIKKEENKLTFRFLFANTFNQYNKLLLANGFLLVLLVVLMFFIMLPIGIPIYLFSPETQLTNLFAIVLVIGGMIWIFPASYFGIRLWLVLPAITEERLSVREAFVRSWVLTKRSYFRLVGKWMLLFGLQIPIIFLGVYLSDVLQNVQFLLNLLLLLIDPVFIALPHLLLSFIYINQRAKKEGYDLALLLGERGGSPLSPKLNKLESS